MGAVVLEKPLWVERGRPSSPGMGCPVSLRRTGHPRQSAWWRRDRGGRRADGAEKSKKPGANGFDPRQGGELRPNERPTVGKVEDLRSGFCPDPAAVLELPPGPRAARGRSPREEGLPSVMSTSGMLPGTLVRQGGDRPAHAQSLIIRAGPRRGMFAKECSLLSLSCPRPFGQVSGGVLSLASRPA